MTLELKGFRLSRGKTEYMHCCFDDTQTHEGTEIQLGNQTIQQVDKFSYLGSIIQKDCEVDSDVNNRIQAGWVKWRKATGIICDRKVKDKIKGKFYRTAIRPAMLYGSECWALKRKHEHKMAVAEMRMLRWMCGHTIKDRIYNDHIRERVGVTSIAEKMVESRLRWFGHVQRRELDEPVRTVDQMVWSPYKRGRGRPKRTLNDIIQRDLLINNISPSMAIDRTQWRRVIHVADPN